MLRNETTALPLVWAPPDIGQKAALRSRRSGISPFGEFLEALPGVVVLYRRFGRQLNELSEAGKLQESRVVLDDLMVAAAAQLSTVSEDAMVFATSSEQNLSTLLRKADLAVRGAEVGPGGDRGGDGVVGHACQVRGLLRRMALKASGRRAFVGMSANAEHLDLGWVVAWSTSEGILSTAKSRVSAGQRPDGGVRWPKAVLWDMDDQRSAFGLIRVR